MLRSRSTAALMRRLGQAAAASRYLGVGGGAAGGAGAGTIAAAAAGATAAGARAPVLAGWGARQARCLTDEAKEAIERTLVVDTLATVRPNCPRPPSTRALSHAPPRRSPPHAVPPAPPIPPKHQKQSKQFESVGLDRRAAEAMTTYMTEQIILDRGRLAEKFVHKSDLEKTLIEERALVAAFKAELSQKQDMHLATLHKDLERQQAYLDKMRAEVRHEIDKLSASQRLDLNLEKG